MKIKKDVLLNELDVINNCVQDTITGHSRWSVHHQLIFEYQGKFLMAHYSVGATEQQEELPWEYKDEVECVEVRKEQFTAERWVPVQQ